VQQALLDSSALFALIDPQDRYYKPAREIYQRVKQKGYHLITTDYLLDEIFTLITSRLSRKHAIEYAKLWPNQDVDLIFVTEQDFFSAKELFEHYHDKNWSFTDCVSFAVMKRLNIDTAFSFDRNFTQAGFNLLK